MPDDVQIFTAIENPECIVCGFSVEALMDALEDNLFRLCRAHLLRANVHLAERSGEPFLAPVLPDVAP